MQYEENETVELEMSESNNLARIDFPQLLSSIRNYLPKFNFRFRKKKLLLNVDPIEYQKTRKPKDKVFSPGIFKKLEWHAMRIFCRRYGIHQADLVRVFEDYLSYEGVYVQEFRVRTIDAKRKFIHQTKLLQEITDIFLPAIFLREFKGLEEVTDPDEITFTRFIITSYLFCHLQIPDLIHLFIAILKRRIDIPVSLVVPYYSFRCLVMILFESVQESGCKSALKKFFDTIVEGTDIRIKTIIRMGIKYPLLFYPIIRFRKLFKRSVFGDHFWEIHDHKRRAKLLIKELFTDLVESNGKMDDWFQNEFTARKQTARAIITDCIYQSLANQAISFSNVTSANSSAFNSPLNQNINIRNSILKTGNNVRFQDSPGKLSPQKKTSNSKYDVIDPDKKRTIVKVQLVLDDNFRTIPEFLKEEHILKIKHILGYKLAKRLLIEAEIPFESYPIFLHNFKTAEEEVLIKSIDGSLMSIEESSLQSSSVFDIYTNGGSTLSSYTNNNTREGDFGDETNKSVTFDVLEKPNSKRRRRKKKKQKLLVNDSSDQHLQDADDRAIETPLEVVDNAEEIVQQLDGQSYKEENTSIDLMSNSVMSDISSLQHISSYKDEEKEHVNSNQNEQDLQVRDFDQDIESVDQHNIAMDANAGDTNETNIKAVEEGKNDEESMKEQESMDTQKEEELLFTGNINPGIFTSDVLGSEPPTIPNKNALSYDCNIRYNSVFNHNTVIPDYYHRSEQVVEVLDNRLRRTFEFDIASGRAKWVRLIADPAGKILRKGYY